MDDKRPKIFVSYAWTNSTYVDRVVDLCTRLMSDGIDVILDKWDLKEGQDKYKFMEKAVNDKTVDRVLLLLNPIYKERADKRTGGVDETTIISPEVYENAEQTKFIPVIFEHDEEGNLCSPAYLKSKIYLDLDPGNPDYEQQYKMLVKNIYDRPLYVKPTIGKRPDWIESSYFTLSPLKRLINKFASTGYNYKGRIISERVIELFVEESKKLILKDNYVPEDIYIAIKDSKPLKDLGVEFINMIVEGIEDERDKVSVLHSLFEVLWNANHITVFECSDNERKEPLLFLIWELFVSTVALLFKRSEYAALFNLLTQPLFLVSYNNGPEETYAFEKLRPYLRGLEERYKPTTENKKIFTLTGDIVKREREALPYLTTNEFIQADILLCQLGTIYNLDYSKSSSPRVWFPITYIYRSERQNPWIRLKSKRFCEDIKVLFGAKTIIELKRVLQENPIDRGVYYSGSFSRVPNILDALKVEEISSLP